MRAERLFSPVDVRCVEIVKPQIENYDDVLIQVKACGVCGSDIMQVMKKGTYSYPTTSGHEFAGVIEAIGYDITE